MIRMLCATEKEFKRLTELKDKYFKPNDTRDITIEAGPMVDKIIISEFSECTFHSGDEQLRKVVYDGEKEIMTIWVSDCIVRLKSKSPKITMGVSSTVNIKE